ncbi:Thiamine-phosphate synthase [Candidatus Hydrogenisulfobacillus filiaventi]|uniref:Thiamine-phosphate synthase n=1 Tax=Candidatus Hydrogenisulfobacillus filiaventi TaxID=2707344 RepID=A0A6F8ZGP7_9FIRM|nr:Thiamine-phosphate synthase [Candidatus Hydrogenisulfobacillus filiaventi]
MFRPRLVGMIDWPRRPSDWLERVAAAAPDLDAVILRAKALSAGQQLQVASRLLQVLAGGPPLLVADRADVARAAGTAGVHLPGDGLPPAAVRAWWPSALISVSVHVRDGLHYPPAADWAVLGHAFPTRSKPGLAPLGEAGVARAVAGAPLPVLAIGGITPDTVPRLATAGLAGVVVVDALWTAPDPRAAARALRAALAGWAAVPRKENPHAASH